MQKGRFFIAVMVFCTIAVVIPLIAGCLPDHTRTFNDVPDLISRAYIDRVVNYAVSGKRPDMVVAGSSLVVFPHVLADGYFEHVSVPIRDPSEYPEFLAGYVEMAHFKRILTDEKCVPMPANYSIVDLGVPSLMLTDCDMLFEKLEVNGCLPKVAVLLLAPRDFMDNTVAKERNLFLYEVRGKLTLKELSRCKSLLLWQQKLVECGAYLINAWAKQFRASSNRVILAVKKLGRPVKRELPSEAALPEEVSRRFYFGDGKFSDLRVYDKRYNPPDYSRIDEQLKAMGRVLDRLKSADVKTVVINMPLTRENRALIDKRADSKILEQMRLICARRGVYFFDENACNLYTTSDFVDSVHLNAIGGDRLFRRLSSLLCRVLSEAR